MAAVPGLRPRCSTNGRRWSPESLAASKAAVVAYTTPYVWDPVLTTIMHAPTWVVFGVLGIGLYWLGQKRKPAEVYIN